jgi:hypothetical protein
MSTHLDLHVVCSVQFAAIPFPKEQTTMLRRLSQAAFLCLILPSLPVLADEQRFPYEASVVADQAEVRCGPGTRFYVTGYVNQDDQVTVHRHDHGGWFMIAPPPGSISWIEASVVERVSPERGVVRLDPAEDRPARAIVRIGSEISDDHSYYGRELSQGDEVQILDEKTLETQRGPVRMFKITPPSQEFRWIKGELVVPLDDQVRQRQASDPYQVPPEHRRQFVRRGGTQKQPAGGEDRADATGSPSLAGPAMGAGKNGKRGEADSSADTPSLYDRLDEIDQEYARMMQQEPVNWDLEMLERKYRQLSRDAGTTVRALIDQRLQVLTQRREIFNHYQKFVQLTTETSQRDARLQGVQTRYEVTTVDDLEGLPVPPRFPEVFAPENQSSLPTGSGSDEPDPAPWNGASTLPPLPEGPRPEPIPESDGVSPVAPRLNGAGIIQRVSSFPGGPSFVLATPEGRLLAYLEPAQEEVAIQEWIGKPAGVIGHRQFDPRLRADVIRVQRIVPVRLVP